MSIQLQEIKNIFIKNRLTEGVDFKRYEWLKMDIPVSTIIDMMSLPINSNNVEFKRNWIQITNSEYFETSTSIYYITDYGDMHDLHPMIWRINPSSIQYFGNINLGLGLHTIITNSNGVTISGNSKVASLSWYGNQITYMKFNSLMVFNTHTIHLTSSIKVDGVTRYVPCQLLKSIPATLDANNIARNAGECGMYDSISGKFYGNVASSGTFTVEGDVEPETHSGLQQIYQNRLIEGVDYEIYDWLRSTSGAQIGLNYTNNGNFNIELKGKELKAVGTDATQILGGTFGWGSGLFTIAIRKSTGNLMFANNTTTYPSAFQEFTLKVIPSETAGNLDVDINNTVYQITKKKLSLTGLFYWYSGNITQHTEGCVGHLKVDNYCDMYPCQLLRSIPRNLDAQCKSRVAGECGMIDLISGKFYGNVANSGTFTVENDSNE